ncbi:MAG: polyhydroxybutyrate depolymerase, partial [Planctomycetes bacterium]|nr:polyhydroxybutyrate depolymerase [Planctomycetota bacterium]
GEVVDGLVGAGVADARRVYVTGISNGAYMANHLACVMGERIAGIAPVAGTFLKATMGATKAPRAMPVIYFHGTEDRVVGYEGTDFISKRDSSLGAEELVAWWAKANGCEGEAEVAKVEDKADDGTAVERREWKGGKAPVVFYRIEGGGHTWPGMPAVAERLLGKSTQDIEASELIWEFFAAQQLPAK